MEQKVAFVGVDNILWDFKKEIQQQRDQMINEIHEQQHTFNPFKAAGLVLKDLRRMNYKILIVADRQPDMLDPLVRWLDENNLVYDDIYCDLNKEKLLTVTNNNLLTPLNIALVIDDAPEILTLAAKRNIEAMSIRYEYNKNITDVKKFKNLQEMHEYLIQRTVMSI